MTKARRGKIKKKSGRRDPIVAPTDRWESQSNNISTVCVNFAFFLPAAITTATQKKMNDHGEKSEPSLFGLI